MRAKMRIYAITKHSPGSETLHFGAVGKSTKYPEDGSDEDNTFAKFTPSANLAMQLANPALVGTFEIGQTFYVDFVPVT